MIDPRWRPYLLVLLVAAFVSVSVAFGVFDVVVLSMSIAVIALPFHHHFSKAVRPSVSAGLITITLITSFVAGVLITLTLLFENSALMSEVITEIADWISGSGTGTDLFGLPVGREQVTEWLFGTERLLRQYWTGIPETIPILTGRLAVFFSVLFILLMYGERFWDRIVGYVPWAGSPDAKILTSMSIDTLYALYIVHLMIAVLTFFIALPFFVLLGYGHVVYFSFVCAVCELIPVLGSSVVMVFLGAYAAALGDVRSVLVIFIVGYIGVSVLPEIYVRPVLMGKRVHIHPLVMFIGFVGGIIVLGLAGFVLGPLILVLLMTWVRLRRYKNKIPAEEGISG
jgi:predicted PurR-regulated permease PerM